MTRLAFRNVIVLIFIVLFSSSALAKTLANTKRIDQASQQFMEQVLAGDSASAYSLMSAYAGINITAFIERGEKVSQDLQKLEKNVGKPLSYAKIKTEVVEGHFYKNTYLLKYKTAAIVWELNFYQPDSAWVLVDISYHADINRLFD